MFGSIRNEEDARYVQQLQTKIEVEALQSSVTIYVNQSYEVIRFFHSVAQVGLHTMWNEHFGISIVEMMASGLITVAHNSGGPRADIIDHGETGYLAEMPESYASTIEMIYEAYSTSKMKALQSAARKKAESFSDEVFIEKTLSQLQETMTL